MEDVLCQEIDVTELTTVETIPMKPTAVRLYTLLCSRTTWELMHNVVKQSQSQSQYKTCIAPLTKLNSGAEQKKKH